MASEPKDIITIDNIKLLKVISDPTRKMIIDILYDTPLTPSEIAGKDRKSTRLNSSHALISYAVFCLKKKKQKTK